MLKKKKKKSACTSHPSFFLHVFFASVELRHVGLIYKKNKVVSVQRERETKKPKKNI